MRVRRRAALLVLLGAVAGCAPSEPDQAFARMAVLDARADLREQAIGSFVRATDGQPLAVGDEVRTDETGFAEIEYVDGSLTRLDVETTFVVRRLAGEAVAPEIVVELDAGRMWNRVREVSAGAGRFDVETSFGVATVRGTAFWLACDDTGCNVSVTDGELAFGLDDGTELPVGAGEGIRVGPAGEERRGPIEPELLEPDAWVGRNLALDDEVARFDEQQEGCSVALAGQSLHRATSPDRAVVVDTSGPGAAVALAAREPVTGYALDLHVGPVVVPLAQGAVDPSVQDVRTTVDVARYGLLGSGLYEIAGTATGPPCAFRAYVRVVGRHPLTTLLGGLGLAVFLLGAAGMVVAAMRGRAAGRDGRGALGVASGVVAGLGAAVLLQQLAVLPLTLALLVGAPVVGALLGAVLGRPAATRPPAGTPRADGP